MEAQALMHTDSSIFAEYTEGHNPIKQHLKTVNVNWTNPAYTEGCTFYTYGKRRKNGGMVVNVSPKSLGAIPITISYWEEPYPKQK